MRKERLKRQLREVIFQSMKMKEWLGAKLGVKVALVGTRPARSFVNVLDLGI
jgi:hypothetical protein